MYRIHFDPRFGRFVIQVKFYGCFWRNIVKLADNNSTTESLMFKTFKEAEEHVQSIGLDKLYVDRSVNKFREYMAGKGYKRMTNAEGQIIIEQVYAGTGLQHA